MSSTWIESFIHSLIKFLINLFGAHQRKLDFSWFWTGFFFLNMYYCCQTQICVPNTQKGQTNPNPFGVEKGLFIAGPCKEKGIAHAQKIQSPHWASGKKLLQASFGERSAGCVTFFWVDCWWGNRVVFQESQPSAFWFQTGVHMICSGWIYHPPPGWEP